MICQKRQIIFYRSRQKNILMSERTITPGTPKTPAMTEFRKVIGSSKLKKPPTKLNTSSVR